jgi:dihydroorotase
MRPGGYRLRVAAMVCGSFLCIGAAHAQQYDMILQGGRVFDPKNHIDAVEDIAVKDGTVALVAPHIDSKEAVKTIDVKGFWVTPGLVDIHVHVYAGTGERHSYAGDNSVYPDGFTFRVGVTTVVDAGCSGWRNFEDFKQRIIDRSKTRVLVDLNIVGAGMRGAKYEDNLDDMDGEATGKMALKYPGLIVGIKSAHFTGPEWKPYEQAVKAGTIANIPVMIDYGSRRPERPLYDLLAYKLRPGDIYTHAYSGLRGEQDPTTGKASAAMLIGRKRGIYFDVGHGGGSFAWSVVIPMMKAGFEPDSISTDLHVDSMNAGMKDMLNVADKFLAMGQTIPQVLTEMTWNPAHEVRQNQLGNLSVGAPADIAVFSVEHGHFGFVDMFDRKLMGTQKLLCQLTVRAGKVVYDLNGISADPWDAASFPDEQNANRWTTFTERPSSHDEWHPNKSAGSSSH